MPFTISKSASATELTGGGTVTYTYTITNQASVPLTVTKAVDDKESGVEALFLNKTVPANGSLTDTYPVTFPRIAWRQGGENSVTTNEWAVIVTLNGNPLPEKKTTATVTNRMLEKVNLTFMCYDEVNSQLKWRARNPNAIDLPFTWYVNDNTTVSPSSGSGTALAAVDGTPTDTFFYTNMPTDGATSINVGLAVDGYEQARKSSNLTQLCEQPPQPPTPTPGLSVSKLVSTTNDPTTGQPSISLTGGSTVYYFYTITNSGNVTLTLPSNSVDDDQIAEIDASDFFPEETAPYTLGPGQSVSYQFSQYHAPRAEAYVNTFEVTAYPPDAVEPIFDDDDASVTVSSPPIIFVASPNFTVSKSVSTTNDPATGQSSVSLTGGGTVYYFYTINNTGNVALEISEATDDKLGSISFAPISIFPGQQATATAEKTFSALPAGSDAEVETNVISVTASYGGATIGPRTASATVTNNAEPLPPQANLRVRVFDNSPRNNGVPVAIPGASVSLSNGDTGTTDEKGEILFTSLPLGTYTAQGTAADPTTGNDPQTGSGSATLSTPGGEETINILLSWTPPLAPPTPPPVKTGKITVRVFDSSARNNGRLLPIEGATVNLAGRTGTTNAQGTYTFENLPFALYTATAEAVDPQNPSGNDRKSGSGQTEISSAFPHEQITILLAWEASLASAMSAAPVPGNVAGRICAPQAPGAEIVATSEGNAAVKTFIAATGTLGSWMEYKLEGLAPGAWTLTLTTPGQEPAHQRITVKEGETVQAADFTLACTGQPSRGLSFPPYLLTGGLMVLAGLLLRRYSKTLA